MTEFLLQIIEHGMVFAETLFGLFKDPRVAIGLVLFMITLCIVVLCYLYFAKISPVKHDLIWVSKQIRQLKSYSDLVDVFPKIDTSISRIRVLSHPWGEFKKTLIFPEINSKQPIRNTTAVSDYLNMENAKNSGLEFSFFHAMTDYFVGMGLVFTFLGLISALSFASAGLAADDPNETKRQFSFLLEAATFKFLTSVTGVTLSIVYGYIKTKMINSLHHYFARLSESLEVRMIFATPEAIAFAQYRELLKQNKLLNEINTKQSTQIS